MAIPDLPSLLRLVDDPSPRVSEKVAARLRDFGDEVWSEIEARDLPLSASQRAALEHALAKQILPQSPEATQALWNEWRALSGVRDEILFLEGALCALSSWLRGSASNERTALLLDQMAQEFGALSEEQDALALARFLFESGGMRGADAVDFYETRNSDLLFALEEGFGLPITLSCVFILVGARRGLSIEGCNFPGHFLAREASGERVFDPYNGGRLLSAREVAGLRKAAPLELSEGASSRQIIARVLRNLSVAFHHSGKGDGSGLMLSLLHSLDDQ
jgi:hypothetical protein